MIQIIAETLAEFDGVDWQSMDDGTRTRYAARAILSAARIDERYEIKPRECFAEVVQDERSCSRS